MNSVFSLGYSGTIMVPLGWAPGAIGLILSAAISLYASSLMAKLHLLDGKRHIRYRDLAGHIYGITLIYILGKRNTLFMLLISSFVFIIFTVEGRKAYSLTWGLQYANLFMVNTGYIILAGQALKV